MKNQIYMSELKMPKLFRKIAEWEEHGSLAGFGEGNDFS